MTVLRQLQRDRLARRDITCAGRDMYLCTAVVFGRSDAVDTTRWLAYCKPLEGRLLGEIFDDIAAFGTTTGSMVGLVGLDLGTKTIGVAVSDVMQSVSTPLETIRREKFTNDAKAVLAICDNRSIGGIILGLPLNMDGSDGPRVQSTRAFARNLSRMTTLPIGFWDERLSTVAAERALLEADTTRKRRGQVIDHVAAGYILQGALDRLRHIRAE